MSHKITTPPINYYDDESRYGEYQYVTLTELVNNFITNMIGDDKLLSNDINSLLEEYPEIEERRRYLEKNKKDLLEIKKLIENIF